MLQARGNKLVHNGAQVMLRGVATGDPLLGRPDRPAGDYRVLAGDWRCNLVRIGVHPGAWENRRAEALDLLDRDVAAALANRMWVVIAWHAIGWPDGHSQPTDPSWGFPYPLYSTRWDLALSFWRAIVGRYGGEGRIAFELWNEPVFDPDEWPVVPGAHWPELKARYEELLALVRAGSDNLVLLGGDRWAYDLRGIRADPVRGGNVGYAWHVYAGHDGNDGRLWARRLDDLDRVHPVVVTEWGFSRTCGGASYRGTPESFGRRFMREFLDGREMSWTGWVWHPEWGPAMLERDWSTPTEFGRFVRSCLAQGSQPRP